MTQTPAALSPAALSSSPVILPFPRATPAQQQALAPLPATLWSNPDPRALEFVSWSHLRSGDTLRPGQTVALHGRAGGLVSRPCVTRIRHAPEHWALLRARLGALIASVREEDAHPLARQALARRAAPVGSAPASHEPRLLAHLQFQGPAPLHVLVFELSAGLGGPVRTLQLAFSAVRPLSLGLAPGDVQASHFLLCSGLSPQQLRDLDVRPYELRALFESTLLTPLPDPAGHLDWEDFDDFGDDFGDALSPEQEFGFDLGLGVGVRR